MRRLVTIVVLALALQGCAAINDFVNYYEPAFLTNLESKMDKAVRESTPWNPKGMAPGSCGAAYLCDDGSAYKASSATHKRHAKKRCACTARAWKRCLPLHTAGTPAHQECVDQHLEFDRGSGRIE